MFTTLLPHQMFQEPLETLLWLNFLFLLLPDSIDQSADWNKGISNIQPYFELGFKDQAFTQYFWVDG